MKYLGPLLDWIGKSLSRVQSVTILLIIVFTAISLFQNGCSRNKVEDLVERVTGLNVQNDILNKDILERDSILKAKDLRIQALKDSIFVSEQKAATLKTEYGHLEAKYAHLAEELLKVPVDSSYAFLVDVAYPYGGDRRFPFSEPQVKGIHLSYKENEVLRGMNAVLQEQQDEIEYQLANKSSVIKEQAESLLMMDNTWVDMQQIIENKDEEIILHKKQIKKERRKKILWQAIGAASILFGGIIAVGG